MSDLHEFIDAAPKVELHLHIEGSLEPAMLFDLAQRNGIDLPFDSVEAVRAAYDFGNLQDFLDIYYQGMNVLRSERDFYDLTWAYLERAAAQNIVHTEIFFDPQGHTERGIAFETVIDGIHAALTEARARFGISSRLIPCFLRHLSEASAFATLEQALPHRDRIAGFGLDSSERGHPPSKFERVFARVRDLGLRVVAHAGEEGPPEYVREALDLLRVDRIDHGNRSLEDPGLVARLVAAGMPLTVCPLSNLKLCVVGDLHAHPLRRMLDLGLKATVNSDDPSYFGGYLNENLRAVADALELDRGHILTLLGNAIDASFLAEPDRRDLHARLAEYAAA